MKLFRVNWVENTPGGPRIFVNGRAVLMADSKDDAIKRTKHYLKRHDVLNNAHDYFKAKCISMDVTYY